MRTLEEGKSSDFSLDDKASPESNDRQSSGLAAVSIARIGTPLTQLMRNLPGMRKSEVAAPPTRERDPYSRMHEPEAGSGGGGRFLLFSFLICVLLPSILALFYYAMIASDQYVSEAKVTVKVAAKSSGGASQISDVAGSFMGKLGLGRSGGTSEDSRIILDYVRSRAAIEDVGGREKLATFYDRSDIDWFSRLDSTEEIESMLKYWRDKATASLDTLSNIVTLRVKAFTPEDSLVLAQELVHSSERLINEISRRSRADAMGRAKDEVARSMSELADARLAMLTFQQSTQSIDPIQSAKQITSVISKLTLQKIEFEGQLAVADSTGVKGRPGDRYVQARLDVVNAQLSQFEKMLTGKDYASVSVHLKDYELLKLRQEFAEQIYTLSRASFEEARRNLEKQQFYLVVVVPPMAPERATYPIPAADAGVVFLSCFVLWAIGTLLAASIRDSNTL